MHRHTRQILLASLLALYGVMTACGPALHALPGAGHVKNATPAEGDGSDHPASPHDDCSICFFLAQSQICTDLVQILSMDVVEIRPTDELPSTFPPSIDRPSAPRAPPIA